MRLILLSLSITLYLFFVCSCKKKESVYVQNTVGVILDIKEEFKLNNLTYLVLDLKQGSKSSSIPFKGELPRSVCNLFEFATESKIDIELPTILENNSQQFFDVVKANNSALDQDVLKQLIDTSSGSITEETFLNRIGEVSLRLMNPDVSGYIIDTLIPNNYSTSYLDNKTNLLGWQTFIFDKQLILWNCFKYNDREVLLFTILNKGLFAGFVYDSEKLSSPYDLTTKDLLKSPIPSGILQVLYNGGNPINTTNIATSKQSCNTGKYPFLDLKYLKALSYAYKKDNRFDMVKHIERVIVDTYPNSVSADYRDEEPIVAFDYVRNNANLKCDFDLTQDTLLQLFTVGQIRDEIWPTDRVYGRDFINIDLRFHEKNRPFFRSKFYYNYPYLNGSKVKKWTYPYLFKETENGRYLFEVCLEIQYEDVSKSVGQHIDLQLEVNDSDENPRNTEALIAISDRYKELQFIKDNHTKVSDLPYTTFINDSVIIDGVEETIWKGTEWQSILHTIYINKDSDLDISARFKSLWNGTSLWFLVEVTDQCKTVPWIQTQDYCRIINRVTGELMWCVVGNKNDAFPFFNASQTFKLPKGKYTLEYISDASLSFASWEQEKLPYDFYGAYLYFYKPKEQ